MSIDRDLFRQSPIGSLADLQRAFEFRACIEQETTYLAALRGSDKDLEHFKRLTNLKYLLLDHTQISDRGLEHLKGMTNLITLDLTGTQVTAQGVADLKKALPNCKITGP